MLTIFVSMSHFLLVRTARSLPHGKNADEALEFKDWTFDEVLECCRSVEVSIIKGHEEGWYKEKNAFEYASRLYEDIERIAEGLPQRY